MSCRPPRFAAALLHLCAAREDAAFVAGDLEEELGAVAGRRGARAARRWYRRQVARSLPSLLRLRARREGWVAALAIAALAVVLPLVLADRMWSFVYSQVPLREGLTRTPGILLSTLALTALGCAFGSAAFVLLRPAAGREPLRASLPLAAAGVVLAAWALAVATARLPAWYAASTLLTVALAPPVTAWALSRLVSGDRP